MDIGAAAVDIVTVQVHVDFVNPLGPKAPSLRDREKPIAIVTWFRHCGQEPYPKVSWIAEVFMWRQYICLVLGLAKVKASVFRYLHIGGCLGLRGSERRGARSLHL